MVTHDFYLKRRSSNDIMRNFEEISKEKTGIIKNSKNTNFNLFYPSMDDLNTFPLYSMLIGLTFRLKKSYTSKADGEFYLLDNRTTENPIIRDQFLNLPMVRSTNWKGNLRYAANFVKWDKAEKQRLINELFGFDEKSYTTSVSATRIQRGRLFFYPTFFATNIAKDVITPLDSKKRTPTPHAPIFIEIMEKGTIGDFFLLYLPNFENPLISLDIIVKHIDFLTKTLTLMFYTLGFSAKKTSGFGIIEENLEKGCLCLKMKEGLKKENFTSITEIRNKFMEILRGSDE